MRGPSGQPAPGRMPLQRLTPALGPTLSQNTESSMVTDLPPGLTHLFAQTKLYTDGEEYVIISLPVERQREAVTLPTSSAGAGLPCRNP